MELVDVQDISFRYDSHPVLSHIHLTIQEGDFLAVLGPNGSGKTTLVKIILGLLEPTEGRVKIMGESLEDFSDWRKIGYIPQKATHVDLFFPATVEEVVSMTLLSNRRFLSASRKEDQEAVKKALRVVGMEAYGKSPIGRLSGGQQQRVFIARALVSHPRILFLDEPTTGVDTKTQNSFYDMLDELNKKEGITIVLITHEIGIINKHVTKVACLNQSLVYHGSHEEFCRSEVFRDMVTRGDHLISHEH